MTASSLLQLLHDATSLDQFSGICFPASLLLRVSSKLVVVAECQEDILVGKPCARVSHAARLWIRSQAAS